MRRLPTTLESCRCFALCISLSVVSACASIAGQNSGGGALQDVRQAMDPRGYPDLSKIPVTPTNLPTVESWASFEQSLRQSGAVLNADPRAILVRDLPDPEVWAVPLRREMASNPGLAAAPGWMRDGRWYDDLRQRMDQAFARQPR
jgi:hypothetical protein